MRKLNMGGFEGDLKPIDTFVNPKDLKEGHEIVGTYQGKFDNQYGTVQKIQTAKGLVGLNSTKLLSKLLEQVEAGTQVKIVYRGMEPIKKGPYKGKKAHRFDAYADEPTTASSSDKITQKAI